MFKRFLSYYKPHWVVFALDMLASFFVSLISVFYPVFTRKIVGEFTSQTISARVIWTSGIVLLALYIVRMFLNYFIQYKGHEMGVKMQAEMRRDMFERLQGLPYGFYDDHKTGKIMSRMTNDLFEISELAHHGPENIIVSSITIIVSFIYLSTISIYLTLILFSCAPVLFIITVSLRKRMKNAFDESREAISEINASTESSISGIRTVKAFSNDGIEMEKFEKGNSLYVGARKKAYNAMGWFHSSTNFVANVFNVVILIAGGFLLSNGTIDVADYSAFIVSVGLFITPVSQLISFMEQFQDGASGFKRFIEIMDTKPEEDAEDAVPLESVEGEIEFKNVSCDYGTDKDVLHGVSLTIEKGKTFALVGPSGGGKTTICHLIPRFYETCGGDIYIDGKNTKKLTLASLRRSIGIVQQDVYLFNATIKENILYGKPDATDEEVIEAAKHANIHDFIVSLEKGYDTEVGERGVKLSGGQKQRLSIARVFLKNPPILILDEATSALDTATEIMIQNSLDELCKGRTTIVVAHRLSTVKGADVIAVIEDGRVTEKGTHAELLSIGGTYAGLYNSQLRD